MKEAQMSQAESLARGILANDEEAKTQFLSLVKSAPIAGASWAQPTLASTLFALRLLHVKFHPQQNKFAGDVIWESIKILAEQPTPNPHDLAGLMTALALYQPVSLTGAVKKIEKVLSPLVYLETILNMRSNYIYARDGEL